MILKCQLKSIINLDDPLLVYERRGLHFQLHYGNTLYGIMNRYVRTVKEAKIVKDEIIDYNFERIVNNKGLEKGSMPAYSL